jgi:hypothetical protein
MRLNCSVELRPQASEEAPYDASIETYGL